MMVLSEGHESMTVKHQDPRHGKPRATSVVTALKSARVRLVSAPRIRSLAVPGVVYMQDDTQVSLMSGGYYAYAGYYNGSFQNYGSVVAAFPGARHLSITPDGASGAMCIDIEPGDASPSDAPGFFRNGDHGGALKPWFYCSAGTLSAVEGALAGAGISRDRYFLWSAHYIGEHFCGPSSCGYGSSTSDATQFATGNVDTSCVRGYCFSGTPASGPPAPPALGVVGPGSSGADVTVLQKDLNKWGARPALAADGSFGPKTELALRDFQSAHFIRVTGKTDAYSWALLERDPKALLPAPENLSNSLYGRALDLSWGASYASKYRVQVMHWRKDGGVYGNLVKDAVYLGQHAEGIRLPGGGMYAWRVEARPSGEWSPWKVA